jgi:hypothetical protein
MYIKYSWFGLLSLAHVSEKNMRLMLERKMKKKCRSFANRRTEAQRKENEVNKKPRKDDFP